jgi:D-serine deaminase-like pyridoxal phosphate-dependent protein
METDMSTPTERLFRRFLLRRISVAAILLCLVCFAGLVVYVKPADLSGVYADYFANINNELRRNGIGRPSIVLDLDRVDYNIKQITARLAPPLNYRIVTKSLPSRELLKYVMRESGTDRLMAFHAPYLAWMIRELPNAEILLGKPLLLDSVAEVYAAFDPAEYQQVSNRIEWLVDTEARLNNYLKFAIENSINLKVNLEIDVGLHRGGVATHEDLASLLQIAASNPKYLTFTGFMGYEAHVPFAPSLISSVSAAFNESMQTYAGFVSHGIDTHPQLFERELTFNSGGSKTYRMFTGEGPVNDISAGSAIVKPATFAGLDNHRPALFIAAPVIKKLPGVQLAFLESVADWMAWWNPNMGLSLYLYGGGWAADIVSPPGIMLNELAADPPNQNLMPNQSLYHASTRTPVGIGDFVFFHPQQSDAMSQFEEILVLRGGKLVDKWHSFPRRY